MDISETLSRHERRAAIGLASIYGLRMLGMFLILPVFALYAAHIPGGANHLMVGLALGAYGLTQALLQLPFGMISDRIGRKKVIVFGLVLFALGSFVAAMATSVQGIILGRVIQGAGAVSAVVSALLADLTREEHRTKAMASIGATIALTFAVSLVMGPLLDKWIGVPGIFALTGILAIGAILVVMVYVPKPLVSHFHADAETNPARLKDVLKDTQLLRLNFGIFALHTAQMAMFVVVPVALADYAGLPKQHHWWVYLPVVVGSFLLAVPGIIIGEKRGKLKQVFTGAIALMLAAQLALALSLHNFTALVGSLFAYFVAFNLLEATLPSLISKLAPASAKGTAMGVYNTSQSLGLFVGGVAGGWLAQHQGFGSVFVLCAALMGAWLVLALGMRPPPAVKTRMFRVEGLTPSQAQELRASLGDVAGVVEATVLSEEGVAMLKVKQSGWDEAAALSILQGEA
ncbi:MAG: MFS transporter [Thiobacillaceae bacterium]